MYNEIVHRGMFKLKKIIKTTITIIVFGFFVFTSLSLINTCFAIDTTAMDGLNATVGSGQGTQQLQSMNDPKIVIGSLVGQALSFVGILFFLLMIYGGFKYMISMGNEQDIENAKELIKYAVIGLVIILSAYAITSFIGTSLTNT